MPKLELLVFKKSRVYVVNPQADDETLEGEWPGIGIFQPSQVCETEQGIVWINQSGLYLYNGDGDGVVNILDIVGIVNIILNQD